MLGIFLWICDLCLWAMLQGSQTFCLLMWEIIYPMKHVFWTVVLSLLFIYTLISARIFLQDIYIQTVFQKDEQDLDWLKMRSLHISVSATAL